MAVNFHTTVIQAKYVIAEHLSARLPCSGKLLREKTFVNFTVLWLFAKVFSMKFEGVASFSAAQTSNPQKFSPSKVSHCTVLIVQCSLSSIVN